MSSEKIVKDMIRFTKNITRTFQDILYVLGISIHNYYTNECVSDFSCCYEIHTPLHKKIKSFVRDMKRLWRK